MVWPGVMDIRQPRQVRKEAAVNGLIHVPPVNWIGTNSLGAACGKESKVGCTTFRNRMRS